MEKEITIISERKRTLYKCQNKKFTDETLVNVFTSKFELIVYIVMIRIVFWHDDNHSLDVCLAIILAEPNSHQETDHVRMGRDKYCKRYETGHLVSRIKTVDFIQGVVVDAGRWIE